MAVNVNVIDIDTYISVNDFECIKLPPCNHFDIDFLDNIFKLEWWNSSSQEVITIIHSLQNWYSTFVIKVTQVGQPVSYFYGCIESEEINHHIYYDDYILTFRKESIDSERMAKLMAQINHYEIVPYNLMYHSERCTNIPIIRNIYYVSPHTTVEWSDNTITTVKAFESDKFDKELGLAMAIAKKYYECLGAPNPRAAIRNAAFRDAHDMTRTVEEKRKYKINKKLKNKRSIYDKLSNGQKTRKRQK